MHRNRKLAGWHRACAMVAFLVALALTAAPARAAFEDEIQGFVNANQGKEVNFSDIPEIGGFLSKAKVGSLAALKLKNLAFAEGALSGDVTLIGLTWKMLVFKGGSNRDFFFAFAPARTLKVSDLLKGVPGIQLLDVLSMANQVMAFAVTDQELSSADMPVALNKLFRPAFGVDAYTVKLTQGITLITGIDLGKSGAFKDALNFIGAQSTTFTLTGSLSPNLLDAMLSGSKPEPSLHLTGNLPAFKPKLGNALQIPTTVTFAFSAVLKPTEAEVGYKGGFTIPIGKQDLQMSLGTTLKAGTGEPEVEVVAIMADGQPWKSAFGVKWLTIADYTMTFGVKPSELNIGVAGKTSFGSKTFAVGGSAAWGGKSAGFPIPTSLSLAVDDGPDKVGSIALKDIIVVANEIAGAATGKKPLKPDLAPDMRLAGSKVGEGPFVEITIEDPAAAGVNMGGKLIVLGKTLADVDHAFINLEQGIDIKAKSANLNIGSILKMPSAEVEIVLRLPDRETGEVAEPKVRIKGRTQQIFGAGLELDLEISKDKQYAIAEVTTLFSLLEAQVSLEGKADLDNPGFKVAGVVFGNVFDRLADAIEAAAADVVKGTEAMINGMNEEVHVFSQQLRQARIDKDKVLNDIDKATASARRDLQSAQGEVDKLHGKWKKADDKCGWTRPDKCAEAGGLWIALKTAKGVLSACEKVLEGVMAAAKEGAKAVLAAIEKTINGLGGAIDKATTGLTKAFKEVSKIVVFASNIVGDVMQKLAEVFQIKKLWMGGELAVLDQSQNGTLGIEYAILKSNHMHEVSWNFKNPISQFVDMIAGGKEPTGSEGYVTQGRTSKASQDVATAMIQKANLTGQAMPFNPETCQVYPYLLDAQIAETQELLYDIQVRPHKNKLIAYVSAFEQIPEKKSLTSFPTPHLAIYGQAKSLTTGKGDSAKIKNLAGELDKLFKGDPKTIKVPLVKIDIGKAHDQVRELTDQFVTRAAEVQELYRKRKLPDISKEQTALKNARSIQDKMKAMAELQKAIGRLAAATVVKIDVKTAHVKGSFAAPLMSGISDDALPAREKEVTNLLAKLKKLKTDPVSVCGQAMKQAGATASGDSKKSVESFKTAIGKINGVRVPWAANTVKDVKQSRDQWQKFHAKVVVDQSKAKLQAAETRLVATRKSVTTIEKQIKELPNAEAAFKAQQAAINAAKASLRFLPAAQRKNAEAKLKAPTQQQVAQGLTERKKKLEADLKAAQASLKAADQAVADAKAPKPAATKVVRMAAEDHKALLPHLKATFGQTKAFAAVAAERNTRIAALAAKEAKRGKSAVAEAAAIRAKETPEAPRETVFIPPNLNFSNIVK